MLYIYLDENYTLFFLCSSTSFTLIDKHLFNMSLACFPLKPLAALLCKPQRIWIPCALSMKGFPSYTPPRMVLTDTPHLYSVGLFGLLGC